MKHLKHEVSDQTILITGASSGIGKAVAHYCQQRGYRTIGTVRKESDKAELRMQGIYSVLMDVTNENSIVEACEELKMQFGDYALNGLVNNAGISLCVPWEILRPEDLRNQLEINVVGPAMVSRLFLPQLEKAKGRIVMVSSTAAVFASPIMGPYSCSKFALEAMSDTMRREWLDKQVDVVTVQPGPIKTGIFERTRSMVQAHYSEHAQSALFGNFDSLSREFENTGLEVDILAKKIVSLLSRKSVPTQLLVARSAWHYWVMKWLPKRFLDKMSWNVVYGKKS